MSWIYWLTGQRIQAAVSARELAELAQPGSMGAAYAGCIRANLGLDDGNFEEARRLFSEARSAAEAIGAPDLNVYVRLGLSRLQRQCGNFSEAAQWAEDARKLAGRVDYPQLAGQSLIELARAAWASGDEAGAAAYLVQACAALEPIQANFDLCRARLYLAALPGPNSPADAWTEALSGILEHDYIFLAYQERRLVYPLLAASLESNDFRLSQASAALVEQMQRVPPEPLRIVTLGGLAVWQAGRAIPRAELARRRAGELLALLIVSPGRCLSYDQVGEALGPEQDFEWAKMTFQHATSSLRHALEPELPDRRFPSHYLEVNEGQVRLALPPGSRLDLDAFQEA